MNEDKDVEEYLQELAQQTELGRGDYPQTPHKDTQLQFMRDVVDEDDGIRQAKTANFLAEEAGFTRISVLDYLRIARYAEEEGLDLVSVYLRDKAALVSAVTLGRKGKLIDTLFTVRRETKNLGTARTTTKKGLFGSTTVKEGED